MAYLAFLRRLFAAFVGLSLLGVCLFEAKPLGLKELQAQDSSTNCASKNKEAEEQARVFPALQPWYHLTPQTHVASSSQDESTTDADDVHVLSIHSGSPSIGGGCWSLEPISIPRAALAVWGLLLTSALPTRAP
ncbi:MAG: hypothetical protein FJ343_06875 [Sphingomonadales bacterium]|nr:hypothetical protein [Sphingomonadales bacterium]